MHGFAAATSIGLVEDVVMDKRGNVDHFHNLPQLCLFAPYLRPLMITGGDDATLNLNVRCPTPFPLDTSDALVCCLLCCDLVSSVLRRGSCHSLGHKLYNSRSESLSVALLKEMLGCHGKDGLVGRYQLLDGVREWLELLLHHLEGIGKLFDLLLTAKALVVGKLESLEAVGSSDLEDGAIPLPVASDRCRDMSTLVFGEHLEEIVAGGELHGSSGMTEGLGLGRYNDGIGPEALGFSRRCLLLGLVDDGRRHAPFAALRCHVGMRLR